MSERLIDNRFYGYAGEYLRQHIQPDSSLAFVTAYFSIHAYIRLREKLDHTNDLRFLLGDPHFIQIALRSEEDFTVILEQGELKLGEQLLLSSNAKACAKWIEDRVQVRTISDSNLLHGKAYYMPGIDAQSYDEAHAMLGSSNFTLSGLGLKERNNNFELNLALETEAEKRDLLEWFNKVWEDDQLTEDVKDQVLSYLSELHKNQIPHDIYLLTLYRLFWDDLQALKDDDEIDRRSLEQTELWKDLYEFQRDGVKEIIRRLNFYNGCILSDSVGLGKTHQALAVIKYYALRNKNVLVLAPKKLEENWSQYLSNVDSNPYQDILSRTADLKSHTDLRVDFQVDGMNWNWGNYDLVVIDESHAFRNNAYNPKEDRKTRYEFLIEEVIKAGCNTQVLLLSATPINNNLLDLRNQISLILGGDISKDVNIAHAFSNLESGSNPAPHIRKKLGIGNLKGVFTEVQKNFNRWLKKDPSERAHEPLVQVLGGDLLKLLDALTISRSRDQIETHYQDPDEPLNFPNHREPDPRSPAIAENFPSFKEVDDKLMSISFAVYSRVLYLVDDLDEKTAIRYGIEGNLKQTHRERALVGLMRTNLLKRLESSIFSFKKTVERTRDKIATQINEYELWLMKSSNALVDYTKDSEDSTIYDSSNQTPSINEEEINDLEEGSVDELTDLGGDPLDSKKVAFVHLTPEWIRKMRQDLASLNELFEYAQGVDANQDSKLQELKNILVDRLTTPTINKNKEGISKIIVFTAFSDTAQYLYEHISEWLKHKPETTNLALVTGTRTSTTFGGNTLADILTNFSPRSRKRSKVRQDDPEIDILIATDCISEGQNLQDCDRIVNYDIHWNPVRRIQRFGRIDRIGSLHHSVSVIDMWPVKKLDEYLNLRSRVEGRQALIELTTSGQKESADDVSETSKFLAMRDKQLKDMLERIDSVDDLDKEGLSLAELSLYDFRQDLANFLKDNEEKLKKMPNGLFAVLPSGSKIPPGLVLCLKQKTLKERPKSVNRLGDYYLVYVKEGGDIHIKHTFEKRILTIWRDLCFKKETAYDDLCTLFDTRTNTGQDMSKEETMVKKAVESILSQNPQSAIGALKDGQGLLETQQPQSDDDFELITWLVICNED